MNEGCFSGDTKKDEVADEREESQSTTRAVDGAVLDVSSKKAWFRAVWWTSDVDWYNLRLSNEASTHRHSQGIRSLAGRISKIQSGGRAHRGGAGMGRREFKGREALIGLAQFHDDQFSNARFEDYAAIPLASGVVHQWDSGVERPSHARGDPANPDWAECEQVFRSIRLLEVSACTIPGNEHTLTLSVERGYQGSRPGPRMPCFEDLDPDQRQRSFELWPDISRRMLAESFRPRASAIAPRTRGPWKRTVRPSRGRSWGDHVYKLAPEPDDDRPQRGEEPTYCLESVEGLFQEIVVVDTGSTDRTREIAPQFGARVFDFPWIDDFAAARNAALEHATGDHLSGSTPTT